MISGLGNVYVDEILFQARVHPNSRVPVLNEGVTKEIYRQIQRVLKQAIRARAEPKQMPKSFLLYCRGEEEKCPRCGKPLERIKISGRTSYFCPQCQQA